MEMFDEIRGKRFKIVLHILEITFIIWVIVMETI